ncbi:TolA-binding protein [Sphingorhabdus rigui]|uniref:TolA-binding protein n=1 Tax=Sphingorhabdus rigui TaxID=1282858 RepID=A0A840B382_9SPHN|nr:tetratricopeptide repeat protein [Sphingorhabdus rigui]MBB3943627.1 TolA-binding protein [Sphingorhabdus rigui]
MKFRLALLSGAAFALSASAVAQDANIDGRVGKLEKEMRAVQRQVFPAGAGKFIAPDIQSPTATKPENTTTTSATSDLLMRVDALEAQLATLTGQVEQQGNNMRGLEARLKILEAQLASAQMASAPQETEVPATAQATTAPSVLPAAAPVPVAVTVKPKPVVAAAKPVATAAKPSAARVAAVAAIERPATGDAFEDGYTYGFRLWEAKFYPEAQATLEETLKTYPKHRRASFLRNLLGRAWLDDKKPATAVKVFYDNYKADPRGERAPDSLFFLGSALTDLGKTAEACEAYGELTKAYPDVASGRLADRVTAGKTRAKCK